MIKFIGHYETHVDMFFHYGPPIDFVLIGTPLLFCFPSSFMIGVLLYEIGVLIYVIGVLYVIRVLLILIEILINIYIN